MEFTKGLLRTIERTMTYLESEELKDIQNDPDKILNLSRPFEEYMNKRHDFKLLSSSEYRSTWSKKFKLEDMDYEALVHGYYPKNGYYPPALEPKRRRLEKPDVTFHWKNGEEMHLLTNATEYDKKFLEFIESKKKATYYDFVMSFDSAGTFFQKLHDNFNDIGIPILREYRIEKIHNGIKLIHSNQAGGQNAKYEISITVKMNYDTIYQRGVLNINKTTIISTEREGQLKSDLDSFERNVYTCSEFIHAINSAIEYAIPNWFLEMCLSTKVPNTKEIRP